MSIKDDMLEEHLIATNTCFVCRKMMNENGECDICNSSIEDYKLSNE